MSTQVLTPPRITPRQEFASILKDHEPYAHGDPNDLADRLNGWFDRLMLQSGLNVSPPMMLAVCVCAAVSVGGLALVLLENLLATALGIAVAFVVPVGVTIILRSRRQKQITDQLPAAIEDLSRAAQTGRSLECCFTMVAENTPPPLGAELRFAAKRMEMGLSVSEAFRELPQRTGLVGVSMLTMALSVHEQKGGELVSLLDRLSRSLHRRAPSVSRLSAVTAPGRGIALLMLLVPVSFVSLYRWRNPHDLAQRPENLIVAGCAIGALLLAWRSLRRRKTDATQKQTGYSRRTPESTSSAPALDPNDDGRLFGRLTHTLASLFPQSEERRLLMQRELLNAGYYRASASDNLAAIRYLGIVLPIVASGALLLVSPRQWELTIVLTGVVASVLGWALPSLIVRSRAAERRDEIARALPDMLAMLTMCVSQGMTLQAALSRVIREIRSVSPALAHELQIVSDQARIASIEQALHNFDERVNVPEVHSLTSTLIQTERMGTSVSAALAALAVSHN